MVAVQSGLTIGRLTGSMVIAIFLAEVSTIFVNTRQIMNLMGLDKKPEWRRVNLINGVMLIVTFFIFRIVWFGILLFMYLIPFLMNMDQEEAI